VRGVGRFVLLMRKAASVYGRDEEVNQKRLLYQQNILLWLHIYNITLP